MPSSSLFQRSCTTLISTLLLSASVLAAPAPISNTFYAIDTTYAGDSFFSGFNFFSAADPTHGYTDYVSYSDALKYDLISSGSSAVMRVDNTSVLPVPISEISYSDVDGVGRKSIRIESSKSWTHGLIIADIKHMPSSKTDGCGTWPAFWTLGSGDWPYVLNQKMKIWADRRLATMEKSISLKVPMTRPMSSRLAIVAAKTRRGNAASLTQAEMVN
jgi:hypothetical protein